ncbi:pyridoxal phosphate-dependent aminotransferase [Amycolatopsis suaedae]|uniref:Aminotransferase n=1 Tax=Amycolatopsis suaedae TaxID=2510978 RepID=A0A4Q7J6R1_9PSEU|nr:aminotransferase class I/II-fold pyridoxal phosphate-dependent enzyme [Amycolatopsis suaedae]RZQ63331.1 aminotransferase class I/II-fold pyridoxal phosphate-dependent enzyme [Amycolatopsis suaedae]
MIRHSATLAVDERIRALKAQGRPVLHLGFGEAGLPVLPEVEQVLAGAAGRNGYGPVAGSPAARSAVAEWFGRRGLPTDPAQVLLAPGSKALLFALVTVLPGDVVLPRPAWVSYAAQAALAGRRVIGVDVPAEAGGVPDPGLLAEELRAARAAGAEPGILILTLPDNPTGTVASADLVAKVCAVAREHGLVVISDEIYRDLADEPVHSPALELPERTVVTGGLSKSVALGGYRIGFARLPDPPLPGLYEGVLGVASEIWSSLPSPMQAVAAYVAGDPPPVREHVAASRRLHRAVATAVHAEFVAAGATCRPPRGAFYLYPDLEHLRDRFATGAELAEHLLEQHGVGVLAGAEFGDDPARLRFRVATSLLYGEDAEQRWTALRSEDPLRLPQISASLEQLRDALGAVGRGA